MGIILPKKKKLILDYLQEYLNAHGYAPTLSDIAKKFKVKSLATIHEHVAFLEKNGFITRSGNMQSRELHIIKPRAQNDVEEAHLEGAISMLPLVGLITAGEPIEAIENKELDIPVPQEITRGRQCYILKVRGDSMIESLIMDGDLVVVEKTEYAKNGDMVVAVLEDGSATLKKFYKEKNYIRLQPANKKYKPIMAKSVIIRGRVVGIIRKY